MTMTHENPATAGTREERRGAHRPRSFKGAVMRFNKGYSALDAVVRNLTPGGAQLAMGDTSGVPHEFSLHVSDEHQPRAARVIWRNALRIGVAFNHA